MRDIIMVNQKKVLILLGSPRKNGNSTILAKKIEEGVKSVGGEAELVYLHGLKVAPCNACDACRKNPDKGCVIQDDMIPLYSKIKATPSIVFASPIYWFSFSAQIALVLNRLYAVEDHGNYALTGKNIGVALTYADVDVFVSGGVNALRIFQDIARFVRANIVGMVHGSADKPGEISVNKNLLQDAFNLGVDLCK
jgi:NAD(P)H-dependent FMN reductase